MPRPRAWEQSRTFLDGSAERGAPVYSLLMTRAFNGPFTLREGSSRYDGVPLWRELMGLGWEGRKALASATRSWRVQLREAIDHPEHGRFQGLDPSTTDLGRAHDR